MRQPTSQRANERLSGSGVNYRGKIADIISVIRSRNSRIAPPANYFHRKLVPRPPLHRERTLKRSPLAARRVLIVDDRSRPKIFRAMIKLLVALVAGFTRRVNNGLLERETFLVVGLFSFGCLEFKQPFFRRVISLGSEGKGLADKITDVSARTNTVARDNCSRTAHGVASGFAGIERAARSFLSSGSSVHQKRPKR